LLSVPFVGIIKNESGNAEFGPFVNYIIHLIGTADALGQSDVVERFIFKAGSAANQTGDNAFANRFDNSAIFKAGTIECPERVTGLGTQYLCEVFGFLAS
jgi:hypothetical protein